MLNKACLSRLSGANVRYGFTVQPLFFRFVTHWQTHRRRGDTRPVMSVSLLLSMKSTVSSSMSPNTVSTISAICKGCGASWIRTSVYSVRTYYAIYPRDRTLSCPSHCAFTVSPPPQVPTMQPHGCKWAFPYKWEIL